MQAAVIIKRGRGRSLKRRHPWIFSGAVAQVTGDPGPGDTVEVRSKGGGGGELLARGAYSPDSQIRVRAWTFDPDEQVGPALLRDRLARAVAARSELVAPDNPDMACRLVNAESDGLPGFVVDRYGPYLVCQISFTGAERWRHELVEGLRELLPWVRGIYERSDMSERAKEGMALRAGPLWGEEPPELVQIQEGPCRYQVDLRQGHKTGFYLDQRLNRTAVANLAGGREVLNCFCFTGGFGVAALQAGAASVLNLDSSAGALAQARENARLNGLDLGRFQTLEGDAFKELRRLHSDGRRFDLVVLDPPKFVKSRKGLQRAARGYKDINLQGFRLLSPGGTLVTFSCSGLMPADLMQKIVADAALDAGVQAQLVGRLGPGPDHPIALPFPEGAYLKGYICRVASQG